MLRRDRVGGRASRTVGSESRGNLYPRKFGPKLRSADLTGRSASDGKVEGPTPMIHESCSDVETLS